LSSFAVLARVKSSKRGPDLGASLTNMTSLQVSNTHSLGGGAVEMQCLGVGCGLGVAPHLTPPCGSVRDTLNPSNSSGLEQTQPRWGCTHGGRMGSKTGRHHQVSTPPELRVSLSLQDKVRVCIVGAGVAGAACAATIKSRPLPNSSNTGLSQPCKGWSL
jgi:hypothetical protein